MSATENFNIVGGMTLVDGVNKKKYLVVRDSKKRPYASELSPQMTVNATAKFFANFPAPPNDVKTMDVVLGAPGAPEITNVPIS